MIIKYKKCTYRTTFKVWFFILKDESWLFLRRILRLLKRITVDLISTLYIILPAILICFIIAPIGFELGKYNYWSDFFWDMKNFLLSSVFIVLVSTIINSEKKRHILLHIQFDKYLDFKSESESLLLIFMDIIGIDSVRICLLTDKHTDLFNKSMEKALNEFANGQKFSPLTDDILSNSNIREYIIYISNNFIHFVKDYKNYFNSDTLVNKCDYKKLYGFCNEVIKVLEEARMMANSITDEYVPIDYLINWVKRIEEQLFLIVAVSRRPWRANTDWEKNKNIIHLLKDHAQSFGKHYDTTKYWDYL